MLCALFSLTSSGMFVTLVPCALFSLTFRGMFITLVKKCVSVSVMRSILFDF